MSEDQAAGLRQQAAGIVPGKLPALAITGGKGGVGKTCMAVNLAVLLAQAGLHPLLVDCDLGLANGDVLLGLDPSVTLYDVLMDQAPIGAAVLQHSSGLAFVPAASGREELTRLGPRQLAKLGSEIARAARGHDLVILDTAAGIQREVIHLLALSRVVLAVITPDPTSLTDAYALIKILEQQHPGLDIRVLVNQVGNEQEATKVANRLRQVVRTYLGRDLGYLGHVPRDRALVDAVRRRRPLACDAGNGAAIAAMRAAAVRLKGIDWGKAGDQ